MEFLTDLWLPILVSAVLVFVVSSVVHMVLPLHKGDYAKLAREDEVLASMRTLGVGEGEYMFPCPASMKDMGSPEMLEKYAKGPVGYLTVLPNGPFAMNRALVQWFVYSLFVGAVAAYVAAIVLPAGADGTTVFRVTGTAAFLAYGVGQVPESIWKGVSWTTTLKFLFDGLLYGLATGAAFAWLWPEAGI